MSRKTFTILTIVVILLGAVLGFSIFRNQPNLAPGEEVERPSLFPSLFDRDENGMRGLFNGNQDDNMSVGEDSEGESDGSSSNGSKFNFSGLIGPVKLISNPVLGYTVFKEERSIIKPVNTSPTDADSAIPSYIFSNYPTLKFGDDKIEVGHLKQALTFLYPDSELGESNVFDIRLKEVVQKFQTDKNLGADGIVGQKTRNAIDTALDEAGRETTDGSVEKETVTVARYFNAKEGTFFDFVTERGTNTKITSPAFIGAINAIFSPSGEHSFVSYLVGNGDLRHALMSLGGDGTASVASAPENTTFSSFSPDGNSILFLKEELSGGSGILRNLATGVDTKIFSNPYSEWIPSWLGSSSVFLTTRASSSYKGAGFEVPLSERALKRVFRGISGLTTNTDLKGGYIIYSDSSTGKPELFVFNRQNGETLTTGIRTLPEKCVFAETSIAFCAVPNQIPSGSYPDDWYKGIVQFSDSLWEISLSDGKTKRVSSMSSLINGGVDAVSLNYLDGFVYFVDKNDKALWRMGVK